jgi:hypothetical protein
MSKQTAIEWLVDQFEVSHSYINEIFKETIEQAKQMEKEQITDAYWEGGQDVPTQGKQAEQYYNETYGKETNRS